MLCKKAVWRHFVRLAFLLILPVAVFSLKIGFAEPIGRSSLRVHPIPDTTKTSSPDSILISSAIPAIGLNRHVTGFVKAYVKREDEYLQKMKGKCNPWFRTIEAIFSKYNLPTQLKYLAIVESGLQPKIQSRAGAGGLWQLMPVTAQELGLKINGKTDERLQTYRSTVAAAKYLQSLYAEFGDWLLVLAAYNSGPGAIYAAIKKSGSRNYWAMERFLPAESRGHVKRFIGIHYFFEGCGSVTTQTKAEAKAWQERWCIDTASR